MKNKELLVILPKFFQYHNAIIQTLKKNKISFDVLYDETEIHNQVLTKFFLFEKLSCFIKNIKIERKFNKFKYDKVLVIKGATLNKKTLNHIKNNKSKTILYQWDSHTSFNYDYMIGFFDNVITFDKSDSIKYGISYKSLFSCNANNGEKNIRHIDLCFIGSSHSDRVNILNTIKSKYPGMKCEFLIYMPFTSFIKSLFSKNKVSYKNVIFKKIGLNKLSEIYYSSKCVIDIEFNGQIGSTMRTIEALNHGCKLYTTNINILDEDFYDERVIRCFDKDNIDIDHDFIFNDNQVLNINNKNNWLVDDWLNEILMS